MSDWNNNNNDGNEWYAINLNKKLKRGPERRSELPNIIIETMRLNDRPFKKYELQKYCRIRRTKFLKLLAGLISISVVIVSGKGRKRDPLTFRLVEHYRRNVPPTPPQRF